MIIMGQAFTIRQLWAWSIKLSSALLLLGYSASALASPVNANRSFLDYLINYANFLHKPLVFEIMVFIGLIVIVFWFVKAKEWRDQEHYDRMKKIVKEAMAEEPHRH